MLSLVLFGSCALSFLPSVALAQSQVADPTASIKAMETLIKPALEQSSEWTLKAGLGIVSGIAFWTLVVRIVKA